LRVVAQYADWWNYPGGSADTYAHKLDVLHQHCQAVGRNYDEIFKTWSAEAIAIADTEAEAQRIAAASVFKQDVITGTPAQVAEQLQAFVDLGVEYLIVRVVDFPSTVGTELFAQEVMPRLRAAQGS
jgi:alkanesulfonate monooxygenase SsuD/methylene tetrahydromethanopterin reductase-like flavin-dependent oxidoreductase (luciferase family)